jgi:hypothetical protein
MPDDQVMPYRSACPDLSTLNLNEKLLYDDTFSDLSFNRKQLMRHQDAWESLRLMQAQNFAIASHAVNMNVVISAQSGDTSAQQTTSPVRSAAADNLASGAAPANRVTDVAGNAVAAGMVESVQTNVTSQVSALTEQITALGGMITTALQAVSDTNAAIASSLAVMASALTALAPKPTAGS